MPSTANPSSLAAASPKLLNLSLFQNTKCSLKKIKQIVHIIVDIRIASQNISFVCNLWHVRQNHVKNLHEKNVLNFHMIFSDVRLLFALKILIQNKLPEAESELKDNLKGNLLLQDTWNHRFDVLSQICHLFPNDNGIVPEQIRFQEVQRIKLVDKIYLISFLFTALHNGACLPVFFEL